MTTATRSFFAERKRIVELAGKYRLPAIYFQKEFVDEGGLMSYGADYEDLFRRRLPMRQSRSKKERSLPTCRHRSELRALNSSFLNLKASKQIGLTLSPEFLARANQVIK